MNEAPHGAVRDLRTYHDPDQAVARISEIYDAACGLLKAHFDSFVAGERDLPKVDACYPYLGLDVPALSRRARNPLSYGAVPAPGTFGTTLTQPRLFRNYYLEQIRLLIENHGLPVSVGVSNRQVPLTFALESMTADLDADAVPRLADMFHLPDLSAIDDRIANGTARGAPGEPLPLSLFSADRVDFSLSRLRHYTGTAPEYFQRFVLFTNYQRYVDEFIEYGRREVETGEVFRAFVEPGNAVTCNPRLTDQPSSGEPLERLPQMPAYHLVKDEPHGHHLGQYRGSARRTPKPSPTMSRCCGRHCWLMIGHCGGLRRTQRLGDYVLAHAYAPPRSGF